MSVSASKSDRKYQFLYKNPLDSESDSMEQFLESETHIKNYLLDPETHIKFQFLVYHPETDIKDQFLDPESPIMGKRNYILKPPLYTLKY